MMKGNECPSGPLLVSLIHLCSCSCMKDNLKCFCCPWALAHIYGRNTLKTSLNLEVATIGPQMHSFSDQSCR